MKTDTKPLMKFISLIKVKHKRALVQLLSCVWNFVNPWTAVGQPWCHPTISTSVVPFSSCLQSFPASGSLQKSQLFTLAGQSIGATASASVLPKNIQNLLPLGLTGLISLLSKGLPRVFSNTHFKSINPSVLSLWSNSHIHTRLLENL